MQVLVLIEPKDGGGFRASAGEPFRISAEAASEAEAAHQLELMLRSRLKGTRLTFLELENGAKPDRNLPFSPNPVAGEDWFFRTLRESIDENRQRENEAQG